MEKLLSPDIGLAFWTVLTFLLTALLLGRWGWGPLVGALEAREARLAGEREAAEKARREAEAISARLQKDLQELDQRVQAALARASREGQKVREEILSGAQAQARELLEKSRKQLEYEKENLLRQMRRDMTDLATGAAEKILRQSVDPGVQERALKDFFKELENADKRSLTV